MAAAGAFSPTRSAPFRGGDWSIFGQKNSDSVRFGSVRSSSVEARQKKRDRWVRTGQHVSINREVAYPVVPGVPAAGRGLKSVE